MSQGSSQDLQQYVDEYMGFEKQLDALEKRRNKTERQREARIAQGGPEYGLGVTHYGLMATENKSVEVPAATGLFEMPEGTGFVEHQQLCDRSNQGLAPYLLSAEDAAASK